jgi:hypothetical protein
MKTKEREKQAEYCPLIQENPSKIYEFVYISYSQVQFAEKV